MAKTIKFNLICDNKPVRTIEDLQNNFSIEDVLAYYNNELLHRWLEVRGYEDELEKVRAVRKGKPIEIVKELIKIFNVVSDNKKIEESIYILEYLENRKQSYSNYERQKYKVKSITDSYIKEYANLVKGIFENPKDVAVIKANITEMVSNYSLIVEIDHRKLFYGLYEKSPLAVMCLLMNEKSRKYYLPMLIKGSIAETGVRPTTETGVRPTTETGAQSMRGIMRYPNAFDSLLLKNFGTISEPVSDAPIDVPASDEHYDIEFDDDKNGMFQIICKMIQTASFRNDLGDNLKVFAGMTQGYWKDLEPKGKKYMIISIGAGEFVRSAGALGGDLGNADINNKFVIVDGIDYKSNSSTRELLYMEV